MKLFHYTTVQVADEIDRNGFHDGTSVSVNRDGELWRGVWFAELDLTHDFSLGGVVFAIDLPDDVADQFEWPDKPGQQRNWRAFLIPADIVNEYESARTVLPAESKSS